MDLPYLKPHSSYRIAENKGNTGIILTDFTHAVDKAHQKLRCRNKAISFSGNCG